jgi:hypothetical protein
MEIISPDLAEVLWGFGERLISLNELKAFLSEKFFSSPPKSPFDRMVIGELELALSEFDRGDRNEEYVREIAKAFSHMFEVLLMPRGPAVPV